MERQAKFQSTPLIRGETQSHIPDSGRDGISIHSPHTRGDRGCAGGMMELKISIHSPHTRGDRRGGAENPPQISIHSPHTRGDPDHQTTGATRAISIHSPHTRGDVRDRRQRGHVRFQSTPLIRGETAGRQTTQLRRPHFNPLPSYEGRRNARRIGAHGAPISIHSPHTRGDIIAFIPLRKWPLFQSTPLIRGETRGGGRGASPREIFQSTPLIRGETASAALVRSCGRISIHSPHTRGDSPRLGCVRGHRISIHSPHTRGDGGSALWARRGKGFQSTPLIRGETCDAFPYRPSMRFQSTPLIRGET